MKPEQPELNLLRRKVAAMTAQRVTGVLIIAILRRCKQDGLPRRSCRRARVVDNIERLYNPRPPHSYLDHLSPVELEEQAVLA
ncbi:MAG: hypothetical protein KF849_00085 [Rhizobiaceae bacterium]|nr:hypothetical protein [Rhizobiaceae bacterium]